MSRLASVLAGFAIAAFLLLSPVSAQETPEAAETQDPVPAGSPLVRIEVDADVQPVKSGDKFEVRVVVDNVEHLSAFDFQLVYDSDRVEPVRANSEETPTVQPGDGPPIGNVEPIGGDIGVMGELGEFLSSGERPVVCGSTFIRRTDPGKVFAVCASPAPPVCLGGPVGVSGSGVLGKVVFKSKGGEMASFSLATVDLVSDDVDPLCDPGELTPVVIAHEQGGAIVVTLSGGGGISTLLLAAIIAIIVIVVLVGGVAAFIWYQGRSAGAA